MENSWEEYERKLQGARDITYGLAILVHLIIMQINGFL